MEYNIFSVLLLVYMTFCTFVSVTTDKCQFHSNLYSNPNIFLSCFWRWHTYISLLFYYLFIYNLIFSGITILQFGCVKIMNFMQIKSQNFEINSVHCTLTIHFLKIISFWMYNEYYALRWANLKKSIYVEYVMSSTNNIPSWPRMLSMREMKMYEGVWEAKIDRKKMKRYFICKIQVFYYLLDLFFWWDVLFL